MSNLNCRVGLTKYCGRASTNDENETSREGADHSAQAGHRRCGEDVAKEGEPIGAHQWRPCGEAEGWRVDYSAYQGEQSAEGETIAMAARPISIEHGVLRLNLGCSDALLKGYWNVDLCKPCDQVADLSQRWPWGDSSVDQIKAWDIFEHLPSKLNTMNEAHRVLIPGGQLDLFIPTTDGRGAFQDPTHQSWYTPNDLFYFVETYVEWQRFHTPYGITARFRVIERSEERRV